MGYSRIASWVGVLAGLCVIIGALAALVWSRVVVLPAYLVGTDGTATITEHAHTQVIASDAWFVVLGVMVGLGIGVLAWSWFKTVGWPSAFIAVGAGLLAGLVCWGVGQLLGPSPFDQRLAAAKAGESVSVPLQLHSVSALAVWALAAVAPTLFASALGPEMRPPDDLGSGPRGRIALRPQTRTDPDRVH